jgi:hypothetical protein
VTFSVHGKYNFLCFGKHVKPLVPAALAVVSSLFILKEGKRQADGWSQNNLPNLYHNMIKTCCTGHTQWDKDKKIMMMSDR